MTGPQHRSFIGRLLSLAGTLLRIAIVVGVLLHLTIRDAIPGVAVAYYALPRGLLAGLAFTVAMTAAARRQRRDAAMWLAATAGLVCWHVVADWKFAPPAAQADEIRVMYWNACRGYGGWDSVIEEVRRHDPDLVALGETEHHSSEFRAMWRRELPEYDISFLGGGMMCLVRGTSSDARALKTDGYSPVRELDVQIGGVEYRCLIVDVYAHPLYDRRRALMAIATLADASSDRRLLILGDFNTPVDSVHLSDLRRHHSNAFEQAGRGCIATWPSIAPLLSLDQVWVNSYLQVQDCRHAWTVVSDHRPVLLTVSPTTATPASRESGN